MPGRPARAPATDPTSRVAVRRGARSTVHGARSREVVAVRSPTEHAEDQRIQRMDAIFLHGLAERLDMSANACEIHARAVQGEQALDALLILRTPCNCLVDDEVLGLRHRQPRI